MRKTGTPNLRSVEAIRPDLDLTNHKILNHSSRREVERALNNMVIFDAHCMDKETATQLFKLLPRLFLMGHAWTMHFREFGCLSCHRKRVVYASGGFCGRCYPRISRRLRHWFNEMASRPPAADLTSITRRFDAAQALLNGENS